MQSETDFESDSIDLECKEPKICLKVHSLKRHGCPYEGCNSAFNRPWKLDRHINTHTKNRPYKCDFPACSKDYTNNSHLQRHKLLAHSENKSVPVHICCPFPDCNKVFMNKWNLKRHCKVHKKENPYKCNICSLEFKKHRQLKNHLLLHLGLKPFVCKNCNETFESKVTFNKHERKHKIYICDQSDCDEKFSTFYALRTHLKKTHPQWLKCDFCGNNYLNKWALREHILTHLPVENRQVFVCSFDDCGRYYLHQRNLKHHIKSFHKNINYQCDMCGQILVSKGTLKKHQKLHFKSVKSEISATKRKITRKSRKDKGLPRKSMAAKLSGIQLPKVIDQNLARNNLTPEVVTYIDNIAVLNFDKLNNSNIAPPSPQEA